MARKKKRSLTKDVGGLVAANIGIGLGTGIAVKAGASSVVPALGTAAGLMPAVTTGVLGYHALKGVRMIGRSYKKKRRR